MRISDWSSDVCSSDLLLVEIVTLVLLLLCLRWLPQRQPDIWPEGRKPLTVRVRRGWDLVVAVAGGAGMAALAYAMMTPPLPDRISRYFVAHAYSGGGGTNVANVIPVDFPGFAPPGELTHGRPSRRERE